MVIKNVRKNKTAKSRCHQRLFSIKSFLKKLFQKLFSINLFYKIVNIFIINLWYIMYLVLFSTVRISQKKKAEASADSSPDPSSARASPSPRLLCPRKIVAGGIISDFALRPSIAFTEGGFWVCV